MKKILVWDSMFEGRYFLFGGGNQPFVDAGCSETRCYVSDDRTELPHDQWDAVLFHPFKINEANIPLNRTSRQIYVFFLIEAPDRIPGPPDFFMNDFFNLTITYRFDSDIPRPYGWLANINDTKPVNRWHRQDRCSGPNVVAKNKTKGIAWFVSSCNQPSKRHLLAERLAEYMPVDVYGACGPLKCGRRYPLMHSHSEDCYEMLEKDYKFYLGFENSICRDYVTEKLFQILMYNVVPIVYGGANYRKAAPPNSYIDVRDFKSVKQLADYLKELDADDDKYNQYFWWKKYYHVLGNAREDHAHVFCTLCEMLHKRPLPEKSYNIQQWWKDGQCEIIRNITHILRPTKFY